MMYWLTDIILKDLKLGFAEATVLEALHPVCSCSMWMLLLCADCKGVLVAGVKEHTGWWCFLALASERGTGSVLHTCAQSLCSTGRRHAHNTAFSTA
jgi:hypothetical protein